MPGANQVPVLLRGDIDPFVAEYLLAWCQATEYSVRVRQSQTNVTPVTDNIAPYVIENVWSSSSCIQPGRLTSAQQSWTPRSLRILRSRFGVNGSWGALTVGSLHKVPIPFPAPQDMTGR